MNVRESSELESLNGIVLAIDLLSVERPDQVQTNVKVMNTLNWGRQVVMDWVRPSTWEVLFNHVWQIAIDKLHIFHEFAHAFFTGGERDLGEQKGKAVAFVSCLSGLLGAFG